MSRQLSIVAVIPAYEQRALTMQCVRTLIDAVPESAMKIVIVDDGSSRPHRGEDYSGRVTIVRSEVNGGYTDATNRGIRAALEAFEPDAILLLNNDLEFQRGAVGRLVDAVAGFDLVGPFGRIIARERCEPAPFVEFSCALIRASVFRAVGLLDPRFERGYYSDDDLCLRAQLAGFRIGQVPETVPCDIVHHIGKTHGESRRRSIQASHPIFLAKWSGHEDSRVAAYIRDFLWDPTIRGYGRMLELQRALARGSR